MVIALEDISTKAEQPYRLIKHAGRFWLDLQIEYTDRKNFSNSSDSSNGQESTFWQSKKKKILTTTVDFQEDNV